MEMKYKYPDWYHIGLLFFKTYYVKGGIKAVSLFDTRGRIEYLEGGIMVLDFPNGSLDEIDTYSISDNFGETSFPTDAFGTAIASCLMEKRGFSFQIVFNGEEWNFVGEFDLDGYRYNVVIPNKDGMFKGKTDMIGELYAKKIKIGEKSD